MNDARRAAVLQSVRALAEGIGPRLCGSEAERAAAEWLARQLADAGYDVSLQPSLAFSTFMALYALVAVGGVLAWRQYCCGAWFSGSTLKLPHYDRSQ